MQIPSPTSSLKLCWWKKTYITPVNHYNPLKQSKEFIAVIDEKIVSNVLRTLITVRKLVSGNN
jgi:hypothetical protein